MSIEDPIKEESVEEAPDEDVKELMESHDLDSSFAKASVDRQDTAERVQEIVDDLGVDEDEATELANEL